MTGRRGVPDPEALGTLAPGGLRRAPDVDPVLGAAGSPQQRAATAAGAPAPVPEDRPAVPPVTAAQPVRPAAADPRARERSHFTDTAAGMARARATYLHTHVAEGERSWAEFVATAVRREVERREATYHGGRPWEPVGSGVLPTGRPLGS